MPQTPPPAPDSMDTVRDQIADQLVASGTSEAQARRVGENFTGMYDDPAAARQDWYTTTQRTGYDQGATPRPLAVPSEATTAHAAATAAPIAKAVAKARLAQ